MSLHDEEVPYISLYSDKFCRDSAGRLHCTTGPAIELHNGHKEWWCGDVYYRNRDEWAHAVLRLLGRPNTPADIDSYLRKIQQKEMDVVL